MAIEPRPSRHRSRRLRKKLQIDEFRLLGFALSFEILSAPSAKAYEDFWDAFLADGIEANALTMGGCNEQAFIVPEQGSATEAHRALVRDWLLARADAAHVIVGPLVDARYDGRIDVPSLIIPC
jgi:uncharacterized protein YggL (DUF469 family)